MKRILKWIGIGILVIVGVVVVAAVGLSLAGASRLEKTHDIQAEAITVPTDTEAIARGEQLSVAICAACHGEDLTGVPLIDEAPIGTVYAPNLTGLAETHSDAELVNAIRHAVDSDGRQLMIMPAEAFINFSAEDLGAIIAYLQTQHRLGDDSPSPQMGFMGRVLIGAGQFGQVFPAEYSDHSQPFPPMPPIGANEDYGPYLAGFCTACHGPDLAGAFPPGDPTAPFARNLTPGGELSTWTERDFLEYFETGVTPSGRGTDPFFIPWKEFGQFKEDELRGLWLYLESLPALETPEQ